MTHGDAVMIIKRRTDLKATRLEALNIIFNGELKNDFNCLSKRDLWESVKFLLNEINKNEVGN